MHKYQPRIHLVKRPDGASGQIIDLDNEEYKTFIFPETVFTAVTAYQNQLVSLHFKLTFIFSFFLAFKTVKSSIYKLFIDESIKEVSYLHLINFDLLEKNYLE